jgi:hypothetical protein
MGAGNADEGKVDVFTPEKSASYLRDRLAGQEQLLVEADLLASDLGHLPLALAQATAYMLDLALDCASYRTRLHSKRQKLAGLRPDANSLPDERRAIVAATWSISIERANELRPVGLARPLLELVAGSYDQDPYGYIRNGRFWSPVIEGRIVLEYLAVLLRRPVQAEEVRDALHCLQKLSLISIYPDGYHYYIWTHPALRRVVRDGLPERQRKKVKEVIAEDVEFRWIAAQI